MLEGPEVRKARWSAEYFHDEPALTAMAVLKERRDGRRGDFVAVVKMGR